MEQPRKLTWILAADVTTAFVSAFAGFCVGYTEFNSNLVKTVAVVIYVATVIRSTFFVTADSFGVRVEIGGRRMMYFVLPMAATVPLGFAVASLKDDPGLGILVGTYIIFALPIISAVISLLAGFAAIAFIASLVARRRADTRRRMTN